MSGYEMHSRPREKWILTSSPQPLDSIGWFKSNIKWENFYFWVDSEQFIHDSKQQKGADSNFFNPSIYPLATENQPMSNGHRGEISLPLTSPLQPNKRAFPLGGKTSLVEKAAQHLDQESIKRLEVSIPWTVAA